MIRLENVGKTYYTDGGEVRALDGVSLAVSAGEFVAVRGPSGCGKSTLLSLIGGLSTATTGSVHVNQRNLAAMTSAERAAFRAETIGFVFQMFHLLPYLDVLDNVLVGARPGEDQPSLEHASDLLTRFGLGGRLTHHPAQLSAGECQRVAMARAMLHRPALVLADEPTGNLDPENARAVLSHLGEFQQSGGTVLLVTHEEQAAACAQRTILLRAGRIESHAEAAEART